MSNPMYNAILKWSLTQSDGTSTPQTGPMDPEKRAFLEKAMEGLLEDETKKMKELCAAIQAPEDTDEQVAAKETALEELFDRCDRIDYAVTFHTFGNGFIPTIQLLKSKHDGIREKAASLIALCAQNNPPCQEWAVQAGALELLQANFADVEADVDVRTKALSAISALVQHNPFGEERFLSLGGVAALRCSAEGIARRLKIKSLFFLQWLLRDSAAAAERAATDGLASALAPMVLDTDEDIAENAAGSLASLLRHRADAARMLLAARPGLAADLRARLGESAARAGTEDAVSDYLRETWGELAKVLEAAAS